MARHWGTSVLLATLLSASLACGERTVAVGQPSDNVTEDVEDSASVAADATGAEDEDVILNDDVMAFIDSLSRNHHGPGKSTPSPCPEGMAHLAPSGLAPWCIDRYEAPNKPGADPLVMYDFVEAGKWCQHRGKRLCFDDEWTAACAGAAGLSYPYGAKRQPGVCNDNMPWKVYDQVKLNGWPAQVCGVQHESLLGLFGAAAKVSAKAKVAVEHLEALYQAVGSGAKAGCGGQYGVYDLVGNVEEWSRRRDGGKANFHGNLKGRYWAHAKNCQTDVKVHGDFFRFYEIGFRCCRDPAG